MADLDKVNLYLQILHFVAVQSVDHESQMLNIFLFPLVLSTAMTKQNKEGNKRVENPLTNIPPRVD